MLKKIDSVEIPVKIVTKEYLGKKTDFAVALVPVDNHFADNYIFDFMSKDKVKAYEIKNNSYVMMINHDGYNFVQGYSIDNYSLKGDKLLVSAFSPEWKDKNSEYIFVGNLTKDNVVTMDIFEPVDHMNNEVYAFQANYGDSYDINYDEPITLDGQTIFMTNELEAYEAISQLDHIINNTDGLSWYFPSEYQLIPISLPVDIQDGWTQDQVVKVIKEMHFTNL